MPYILSKRSDFDPGTLYIQDLRPNTSQMNIYRQVGQTGYERDPATAAVTTRTWVVSSPPPLQASASMRGSW